MSISQFVQQQMEAARSAQKAIWTAKLDVAGWDANIYAPETLGKPVFLYVWDQPTKWVWSCAVPRAGFYEVASAWATGKRTAGEVEGVRNGLGSLISGSAGQVKPVPVGEPNWEEQLALALSAYAGTTRIFEAAGRLEDGGHFVVMHYRKGGSSEGKLRPFVVPDSSGTILPADELLGRIDSVLAMDKERHPEWGV